MRPPGRRQETTTERFVSPYELIEEEQASLKEAKKAKDTRESPGVPPALHRETLNKSPHHWWRLHLQGRSLITAEEKEDAKTGTAASPTTENEQGLNTGSLAGNPYGSATAAALEQRGDTPTTLRRPTNPVHKVAVNKVERREDRKWGQQGDTNSDRQGDKQGTRQKPPQEQRGPSVSPRDLPQQQDHQHQPQRQRQSKVLEDAQQQHHHQKCLVGFGVSSSSKTSNTRSISQPRSLRGLMPRLSPPRPLAVLHWPELSACLLFLYSVWFPACLPVCPPSCILVCVRACHLLCCLLVHWEPPSALNCLSSWFCVRCCRPPIVCPFVSWVPPGSPSEGTRRAPSPQSRSYQAEQHSQNVCLWKRAPLRPSSEATHNLPGILHLCGEYKHSSKSWIPPPVLLSLVERAYSSCAEARQARSEGLLRASCFVLRVCPRNDGGQIET